MNVDSHTYYLWVNVGCILFPFLLSFDKKIAFYKTWFAFFPGCLITMLIFIPWDVIFTVNGVWRFNSEYLIGIDIFHLPLEEWLFFITIPYACVFSYACYKSYLPNAGTDGKTHLILGILSTFCLVLCIWFYNHLYTLITFSLLFIMLILHLRIFKQNNLKYFFPVYGIMLIPFIIANGVLTGLEFWNYPILNINPEAVLDQIVWYNNNHNLRLRIFSIPLDDIFYGMLLILMNVTWYEYFLSRKQKKNALKS